MFFKASGWALLQCTLLLRRSILCFFFSERAEICMVVDRAPLSERPSVLSKMRGDCDTLFR